MYIYKLTNQINNKIYIGLTTTTLSKRFACHKSQARMNINGKIKYILVQ